MFREQRWLRGFYCAVIIFLMFSHSPVRQKLLKTPVWDIKVVFFPFASYPGSYPDNLASSLGALWLWSVSAGLRIWNMCEERSGRSETVTISSSRSPLQCIYWGQWRMLMNVSMAAPETKCFHWDVILLFFRDSAGFLWHWALFENSKNSPMASLAVLKNNQLKIQVL